MNNTTNYSILMSVYVKENATFLRAAIDSIFSQTIPPNDFVLVCDGSLTSELDAVIEEESQKHSELHAVRLEQNVGLGKALNYGIKHCRNELVARMDSDDISRPDRCKKQIEVFQNDSEISICSGIVEEFSESTSLITARRVLPEHNDGILAFAKKRNPFNHPCVMYKKTPVEEVGGYKDFYLLEDYFLWIRMLSKGFKGYNIQQPLLWMRAGSSLYKRRSGFKYFLSQKALFKYMYKTKFITFQEYFHSVAIRGLSSFSPNYLREMIFKMVLRK